MHTFETRCVHAGEAPDPTTGAHGVPIYQNVTYAFETYGQVEAMRSGELAPMGGAQAASLSM